MSVLHIEDPETYELAAELAKRHGETLAEAVKTPVRERLSRERLAGADHSRMVAQVLELGRQIAASPVLDARSPDEILGYDSIGIPE